MPHDEELASRLRALLTDEPGLTEKRMFGGLAFLLDGQMAVAANSRGALMMRVAREEVDELLDQPGIEPQEMRGRVMTGWLNVQPEALATDEALSELVQRSVDVVRALPPKGGSRAR